MSEVKKIAVLGIANAGKTSILKCIFQEFESLMNLKPTSGVERKVMDFLGLPMVFWDFGGQSLYRDKYMSNPDQYFDALGHVFYVVDVQDKDMIDASVIYFELLFKEIRKYSPDAKIILLFHKDDPENSEKTTKMNLKQVFLEGVIKLFEEESIPMIMHLTSIKNHLTIIRAFSQSLLDHDQLYDNISDLLKNYCFNYSLKFSIFFTKNGFEIGNYLPQSLNTNEFHQTLIEFFGKIKKEEVAKTISFNIGKDKIIGAVFEIRFGKEKIPFYLVFGFEEALVFLELSEIEEMISKLSENLEKIMVNTDLTKFLE
jgi:Ras-related GTP-binding protein A/B